MSYCGMLATGLAASESQVVSPLEARVPRAMLPEIVDYVMDFLHNDLESLKACSLVSSSWDSSTSHHLFSTLQSDPGMFIAPKGRSDDMRPVHFELKNRSRVTNTVRTVALGSWRCYFRSGYERFDFSSTHEVAHIPFVYVDIIGDMLTLFPRLRHLDLFPAHKYEYALSASSRFPHLALARSPPIDLEQFSMKIRPAIGWIPLHQAILGLFNTVKVLSFQGLGPYDGSELDFPDTPGSSGKILDGVQDLHLGITCRRAEVWMTLDDAEGFMYLDTYLPHLFDFSIVTSLSVSGPLFTRRVQTRLCAVAAQIHQLTHLDVTFDDELTEGLNTEMASVDMSHFQHGLAHLTSLASLHISIPLTFFNDTTVDNTMRNTIEKNDLIFSVCVGVLGTPPNLLSVRITLPSWAILDFELPLLSEQAFVTLQILNWKPLEDLVRRRGQEFFVDLVIPFRTQSVQEQRARLEEIICSKVSDDVRPLLRFV